MNYTDNGPSVTPTHFEQTTQHHIPEDTGILLTLPVFCTGMVLVHVPCTKHACCVREQSAEWNTDLEIRGTKQEDNGENCIVRRFRICILHQILLG